MLRGTQSLVPLAQAEGVDLESAAPEGLTVDKGIEAVVILAVGVAIGLALRFVMAKAVDRAGGGGSLSRLFGRFMLYLTVGIAIFYALSTLGVRVGPLLGAAGVGGLALAFALQEILGNFVAGILLQLRRPFTIGDQVVTLDANKGEAIQGTVRDVNLRVVEIYTFDGETVFVPNSMVLQNPITNWTDTPTRRTTLPVGVSYDTDLAEAQRLILEAVGSAEGVEADPEPQAFVEEFGDSSINFAVRYWHRSEILEMWSARDAVAQAVKRKLDEAGIDIPFPQRTLWFGPGRTELEVNARTDGFDTQREGQRGG